MTYGTISTGEPVQELDDNSTIRHYTRREWSGSDFVGRRSDNRHLLGTAASEHAYISKVQDYWHRGSNPGLGYPLGGWGAFSSASSLDLNWHEPSWVAANAEIELQNRLLTAIRSHDFNLGVAVAEGKETVKLITNTAVTLAKVLKYTKRGQFRKAVESLMLDDTRQLKTQFQGNGRARELLSRRRFTSQDVAGRWLELQYGWLPLMGDVHAAAEAYASFYEKPRSICVRARTKVDWAPQQISSYPTLINANCLTRQSKVVRAYIRESDASWSRTLGLQNPLAIVWELVPYSFVADWFIPIGDWFATLDLPPLLENYIFWETRYQHWVYNCTSTGADRWFNNVICYGENSYVERKLYSVGSPPLPHFVPLDEALSPTRVASAIALVKTAFHGGGVTRR